MDKHYTTFPFEKKFQIEIMEPKTETYFNTVYQKKDIDEVAFYSSFKDVMSALLDDATSIGKTEAIMYSGTYPKELVEGSNRDTDYSWIGFECGGKRKVYVY